MPSLRSITAPGRFHSQTGARWQIFQSFILHQLTKREAVDDGSFKRPGHHYTSYSSSFAR